ncbi:MAG: hypothetical protein V1838_01320 [Patescibacteria group bacterium]
MVIIFAIIITTILLVKKENKAGAILYSMLFTFALYVYLFLSRKFIKIFIKEPEHGGVVKPLSVMLSDNKRNLSGLLLAHVLSFLIAMVMLFTALLIFYLITGDIKFD